MSFVTYETGRDFQKVVIYCDQECRETAILTYFWLEEVLVSDRKFKNTHSKLLSRISRLRN